MLLLYPAMLMTQAKIASRKTYYRLLRDLHEYGYILYKPSFYKGKASEIYLHH